VLFCCCLALCSLSKTVKKRKREREREEVVVHLLFVLSNPRKGCRRKKAFV
jgi:hypothetical protein